MSDLPKGWINTKLGNIVNIKYGKDLSTKQISADGEYPVFGANGILGFYNEYLYGTEQVLISCRGANSGKINYSPPKCYITHNSLVLEVNEDLKDFKRYLYYVLQSVDKSAIVTGSAQPQVTINNAVALNVPLPPLPEQRRIVARLERLLHKVDASKERLDKIPAILKRFRQSVLAAACSGRLTADWREKNPDSEEWKLLELLEVAERIQIGPFGTQLHKADYVSIGIPLINPTHIQGSKIVHDPELSVSKAKFKELENYVLKENDIILGRRGEMGRCALVSGNECGWLCGTGSLFIRPKSCVHPEFLFLILRNGETKAFLESESKGTTMNNLNLKILERVPVSIPPLSEQHEIVRRVEALFKKANEIEARYQKAKGFVGKLTQSILAKAFRGELVPQDPNDEPASVLLERIKVERTKQEPKKRGKKGGA